MERHGWVGAGTKEHIVPLNEQAAVDPVSNNAVRLANTIQDRVEMKIRFNMVPIALV
jgi:hypothetical protein